ncbi:MAG: hypothetical protein IJ710_07545 [Prevotella sp.]|nr:hypothetical protein [Prevotella sp.]
MLAAGLLLSLGSYAAAQEEQPQQQLPVAATDSSGVMPIAAADSSGVIPVAAADLAPLDSIAAADAHQLLIVDSARVAKPKRDWATWRPDPQRALWLALVLPGAGQIYNRKYWKLPLVYGGFMGCIYAMTWNNMMYKDYSQAYLDIMDDDPGTASYNKFLSLGMQITSANEDRYKQIFKSRKDKYRRWRDMSFFVMIGVYALSVIDAYVDAELSVFDISKDLSLKVEPAVINNHSARNPLHASSLGVNCSLNF